MLIVLATIDSKAEDIANMKQAIIDMEEATATEEGSISYTFASEVGDPNKLRVIERWRSLDDLKAHFATPHMAEFQAAMAKFPASGMEVKLYEIAEEIPFPEMG